MVWVLRSSPLAFCLPHELDSHRPLEFALNLVDFELKRRQIGACVKHIEEGGVLARWGVLCTPSAEDWLVEEDLPAG